MYRVLWWRRKQDQEEWVWLTVNNLWMVIGSIHLQTLSLFTNMFQINTYRKLHTYNKQSLKSKHRTKHIPKLNPDPGSRCWTAFVCCDLQSKRERLLSTYKEQFYYNKFDKLNMSQIEYWQHKWVEQLLWPYSRKQFKSLLKCPQP